MRNLRAGVDTGDDAVEFILGNRHGAQAKGTAHRGSVKEGAKTGDDPRVLHSLEPRDQVALGQAQLPGHLFIGAWHDWKAVLQRVQYQTVSIVECHTVSFFLASIIAPVCLKQRIENNG